MKETVKKVAAGLLIVATLGASATALAMGIKHNGWFGKDDDDQNQEQTSGDLNQDEKKAPIYEDGGLDIGANDSHGISLMSTKIPVAMYDAYGISTQAESAFSVTATITPADAANQLVTWSLAWKNPSSTWASGKTVTDYVTIATATDGALTATVTNKAAFGEQIVLKCVSRDNASATATCNVEYLQRTVMYGVTITQSTGGNLSFSQNEGGAASTVSAGTIATTFAKAVTVTGTTKVYKSDVYMRKNNTDYIKSFTLTPTSELKTAITNAGLDATKLKTYTVNLTNYQSDENVSFSIANFFDQSWGTAMYSTNAQKNKLIDALCTGYKTRKVYTLEAKKEDGTVCISQPVYMTNTLLKNEKVVESVSTNKSELVF